MLRKRFAAVLGAVALLLGAQGASAMSLTLTPDRTLDDLAINDMFEVVVGLQGVSEVAAYTLDFAFDDVILQLVGADQLGANDLTGGFFNRAAFTIDPLVSGNRASVLTVGAPIRVDVGANFPPGNDDPRAGLFALKFMVIADGQGILEVGLLDTRADIISQPGGGEIPLDPATVMTSYGTVPEPAVSVLALVAVGFAALRRRA